jgi:capsular polysaccharide transport system permease protein
MQDTDQSDDNGLAARKRRRRARKRAEAAESLAAIRPAAAQRRHWGLLIWFCCVVALPVCLTAGYLFTRAADQYGSVVGFTVRSETNNTAVDVFGGLSSTFSGGSSTQETDILFEFVTSQEMVAIIEAELGISQMYAKHLERDPLLSYDPSGSIEDLTRFWRRMTTISYDSNAGLMEITARAFTAYEANAIAQAILTASDTRINELSAKARSDATRFALSDLADAEERLRLAREELTAFRLLNQIVDPSADIQSQVGLLSTLQTQLAEALIEADLLAQSLRENDPRLEQLRARIAVIEARINAERQKFGASDDGESYARTVSEYERLSAELLFAEQAHAAARTAAEAAKAEAQRQSFYLATYIRPTLAETPEYPRRWTILSLVGAFAFLFWAIGSLVYYSVRDRR